MVTHFSLTLSDKIWADKSAENFSCCRKFCPQNVKRSNWIQRINAENKFWHGAENFVHPKFLFAEIFSDKVCQEVNHWKKIRKPEKKSKKNLKSSWKNQKELKIKNLEKIEVGKI